MMDLWVSLPLLILLGLAGGVAVGGGFVAFLTVLQVIPRLVQLTGSARQLPPYEAAVITGAVFWTMADFQEWTFFLMPMSAILFGWLAGSFVGMLAAGLTEVLNVFPIMARRLGLSQYLPWLLMAVVLGKVTGSLFDWLVFQRWQP